MKSARFGIALTVLLSAMGGPVAYGATEDAKITADVTTTANALFGTSVDVSGTTVVVGALGNNPAGTFAGTAYAFDCSSLPCTQVSTLLASDAAGGDTFGWSVAVSGTDVLVGAIESGTGGAAYYFDLSTCGAVCTETSKLTASDATSTSKVGFSVDVSGTTALVGAFRSTSAYYFDLSTCGAACTETSKLTGSDTVAGDGFGIDVALEGATALVGAPSDDDGAGNAGSAYVFDCSALPCVQVSKLTAAAPAAAAQFGEAVALSGMTAVIGTGSSSESAYYFDLSTCGAACGETGELAASDGVPGDSFGGAVAVSGTTAVIGAATDDAPGSSLSGSAYHFDLSTCGAACTETDKLTASDAGAGDKLGSSVAVSAGLAVAGAPTDDGALPDSGSAYLFVVVSDSDGDGVPDDEDVCPGGDDNVDTDSDGVPDFCDDCPLDPDDDADADGLCADVDNCPADYNPDQADNDGDTIGDVCDPDDDNDGVGDGDDNCPFDPNPGQEDTDGDGDGDACDGDDDGDGVGDGDDACPGTEPGDVVGGDGCSIDQLCPCQSPWKNHGAYVRCVAHTSEVFVELDLIPEQEKGRIVSEAARSDCGKKE